MGLAVGLQENSEDLTLPPGHCGQDVDGPGTVWLVDACKFYQRSLLFVLKGLFQCTIFLFCLLSSSFWETIYKHYKH